tara:strand:- start:30 stop:788 length:759 start_codon:yes stop_codon:yes gene_type:complete
MQKLSIITTVFNNVGGIKDTVNSIIDAKKFYKKFIIEWIVIDGGSNDGTKELLTKFSEDIDIFISESDLGLYYGMNKGLRKVTGDLILFVNSGDRFLCDKKLNDIFPLNEREVHVFGYSSRGEDYYFNFFKLSKFWVRMPCHQAMIFPKLLNNEIVYYNTDYRVNADLDLKLKYFKHYKFIFNDEIKIQEVEAWGVSQNYSSLTSIFKIPYDQYRVAKAHNSFFSAILNFLFRIPWHVLKYLRYQLRKTFLK